MVQDELGQVWFKVDLGPKYDEDDETTGQRIL